MRSLVKNLRKENSVLLQKCYLKKSQYHDKNVIWGTLSTMARMIFAVEENKVLWQECYLHLKKKKYYGKNVI